MQIPCLSQLQKQMEEIKHLHYQVVEKDAHIEANPFVRNLNTHGNMIVVSTGLKVDANNFDLSMPLINRVEQIAFMGIDTEDANR